MRDNNNEVSIRLATKNDADIIIQIQFDAIRNLCTNDYSPQELSALLKDKSNPRSGSEITFIAEIEGKVVGFASLMGFSNIIAAVFVKPRFSRRGIGTKLLHSLEEEAIRRKFLILRVTSSLTGYPFYLANGYQTLRKTKIVINSVPIPCIDLQKRLLPATIFETFWESLFKLSFDLLKYVISSAKKLLNKVMNQGKR